MLVEQLGLAGGVGGQHDHRFRRDAIDLALADPRNGQAPQWGRRGVRAAGGRIELEGRGHEAGL